MHDRGGSGRSVAHRIHEVTVGEPIVLDGPVTLAPADPRWPALFGAAASEIRRALGSRVIGLEHVGSTSVPGLAAKPIIDLLLVVADSADEASYVRPLEAIGYELRIREPDWYEHRVLRGREPDRNLHVFSRGCEEIDRMITFRDHLRVSREDRRRYEDTKRELAERRWTYVQEYADAKADVIEEILHRAAETSTGTPPGTLRRDD